MKAATERVLALCVTVRGFAFCLFEKRDQLYDWGIKYVRRSSGDKNAFCLALIEKLIARYDPDTLVIEDVEEANSKRTARGIALYRAIEALAERVGVGVAAYPRQTVFSVFKSYQPKTKHDIAIAVADMLPAIRRRLPPKRKIWLPQDSRQALFDAAALGITHYVVSE
jgi:Holliday junction resolvasome RuvABC endonuclease subunit